MEIQRDGLTGHIEAAGFPFDTGGWLAGERVVHREGEEWWPYEQTAYAIDGQLRCGHLLGDGDLIARAHRPIDEVLARVDADGYLGPAALKPGDLRLVRWPHAVLFRAVMARQGATGDESLVEAIARHYLSQTSPHDDRREICNIEAMLWAYEHGGDERLLTMACSAFAAFDAGADRQWYPTLAEIRSRRAPHQHGVTYNEVAKLGAILYRYTGRKDLLNASLRAYGKLHRQAMLVDGVHSSAEHIGGRGPLDSHETCDIADYTWSCGYLLLASGDAAWGDRIERACFNAAPGAVRADFKALQYFSCPNQVIADARSNHNPFQRGSQWMSYRPNPGVACCPGAVNRILPNYASRMWLRHADGGVVAALYGPSTFSFDHGGQTITLVAETAYPFGERIDLLVHCARPASFPLHLRLPGWCRRPAVAINGTPLPGRLHPGRFLRVERAFAPGDRITLHLPMELGLSTWPGGGVAIERGPLVFSLRIAEDWQRDRQAPDSSADFPAWNCYPASPWNYALDLDPRDPLGAVRVEYAPMSPEPWTQDAAPIRLHVPARRVRGWRLQRRRRERIHLDVTGSASEWQRGDFRYTPPLPDPATIARRLGRREQVELVPYGCTRLRLTVFPLAGPLAGTS